MSDRLAKVARKVARRKARGLETPAFPVVQRAALSGDPWAGVPETERETIVEVRNGIKVVTYVDTPESLAKRLRSTQRPMAAPASEPALAPAAPPLETRVSYDWGRLDEAERNDANQP